MNNINKIPIVDELFLEKNRHFTDEYFVLEVFKVYLKDTELKAGKQKLYIQQLCQGSMTRQELLESIQELPEFKQLWQIKNEEKIFKLTDVAFINKTFLLKLEDFVIETYRTYLKREPDDEGKNKYIKEIQNNQISREEFLMMLRQSEEFKSIWKVPEKASQIDEFDSQQTIGDFSKMKIEEKNGEFTDFIANSGILNDYLTQIADISPKKIQDQEFIDLTYNITDDYFLQLVYKIYLHRDIDSLGLQSWSEYLMNDKFRRPLFLKELRISKEFRDKWNSHSWINNLKFSLRLPLINSK
ncbi:DUF4214 domain-containing protein [Okeania sp. SIO3I5]|uniref:DUF4214 domain-containing protein n=1 Tax=Okeania sp. SIO3I5 TaxID=2607805 RepID=UPI0025DF94ED|nr:DUF4214 domain-containing protein [Okeania sp. SIO3I5]